MVVSIIGGVFVVVYEVLFDVWVIVVLLDG